MNDTEERPARDTGLGGAGGWEQGSEGIEAVRWERGKAALVIAWCFGVKLRFFFGAKKCFLPPLPG